jgi:hypothetical protein
MLGESLLDPRLAVAAGAVAAMRSERVRQTVGHGLGYGVVGVRKVGGAVAMTGRDIFDSAREVADGSQRTSRSNGKPPARRRAAAAA